MLGCAFRVGWGRPIQEMERCEAWGVAASVLLKVFWDVVANVAETPQNSKMRLFPGKIQPQTEHNKHYRTLLVGFWEFGLSRGSL